MAHVAHGAVACQKNRAKPRHARHGGMRQKHRAKPCQIAPNRANFSGFLSQLPIADLGQKAHPGAAQMSHLSHPPKKCDISRHFATFGAPHLHRLRSELRKTFSSVLNVRASTARLSFCSTVLARPGERVALLADFGTKKGSAKSAIGHMPQERIILYHRHGRCRSDGADVAKMA
jgi:hypothetical protein